LISCAAVLSYRPWLWEQNRQEITAKVWQMSSGQEKMTKFPVRLIQSRQMIDITRTMGESEWL